MEQFIKHFVLIMIYLLITCGSLFSAENTPCRTQIELSPDKLGEEVLAKSEVTAQERPTGTAISVAPIGLSQTIAVELPTKLYRQVEIKIKTSLGKGSYIYGDVAFFVTWPCETSSKAIISASLRNGSATEVQAMWNSRELLQPRDTTTAALYYARALSTAEQRRAANQSSTNQYDLIASYLALRAFRMYANISELPLLESERLRLISNWYLELLERVKLDGLDPIKTDGAEIASHRAILVILYQKKWNELRKTSDPIKQLEGLRRFREAVESEQDATRILADINLSREELIASANSAAGQIEQPGSQRTEVQDLVKKQTKESDEFVRKSNPINSAKLKRDARFLKQRWGF